MCCFMLTFCSKVGYKESEVENCGKLVEKYQIWGKTQ